MTRDGTRTEVSKMEEGREEQARERARGLLVSGEVQAVLGLRGRRGQVVPYLFSRPEELQDLTLSGIYPLAKVVLRLLGRWEDGRLAVIARGCDERHFVELEKKNAVDTSRVELIGVACAEEEARECGCSRPYPRRVDAGRPLEEADFLDRGELEELLSMKISERRRYWTEVLSRCIKCYGCRNSCPLCNCVDCRLEESRWVRVGEIPPEYPSFHLIRAFHLADKCVDCGACQRACPMHIPIRRLHRLLGEELKRLFGYRAGEDAGEVSPLLSELEEGPLFPGLEEEVTRAVEAAGREVDVIEL